jgi:hypothetical protein
VTIRNTEYLYVMVTKSHKIVVRITESQLRWLTDVLIQEQVSKSQIVRNALNGYLIENYQRDEKNEYTRNKKERHE